MMLACQAASNQKGTATRLPLVISSHILNLFAEGKQASPHHPHRASDRRWIQQTISSASSAFSFGHQASYPLFRVWCHKMQDPMPVTKSYHLSPVWYHKKQNPMSVTNRTPVSCVISQDAEPNSCDKSYLLFRVWYHKMQNPIPVTKRTTCPALS